MQRIEYKLFGLNAVHSHCLSLSGAKIVRKVSTQRLLGAVGLTLLTAGSCPAVAGIAVSPNASNPVYPVSMPDPWNIAGPLDLIGSTLSIDNASSVTADALLNGGVILGSTSGSYTFGDIGFDNAAFATFLNDATGNAGTFSNTGNAVSYFGLSNNATFNNTAGGSLGDPSSAIVINLDSASSFLGTGNTVFGGDMSSFSLGPGIEPTPSATGSGDQATMVSEVTSLVTIAKAKTADRAMNAITQFNLVYSDDLANPDAAIPAGVGYTFKVDGDASFGGASSDALIFVDKDSSFEVTGNADFATGGSSVVNIVVIGSEFNVGKTYSGIRGGSSSITQFFAGSDVTIGGDWLSGNAAGNGASVSSFTAFNSTIMVGGHFDTTLGASSANELNWDNVTYTGGGDFRFAGKDNAADNSAASMDIKGSSLTAPGSFISVLGNNSVQNHNIQNSMISLGGDYLAEIGGTGPDAGNVSQVFTTDQSSFTADNFTLRVTGNRNSHTETFDNTVIDLAGNFLIETPGSKSDMAVLMQRTTGSIDGDFTIRGTGAGTGLSGPGEQSSSIAVINEFDVAVGQDIRFELPSINNSSATLAIDQFKATVGGNVVFDLPTDATGTRSVTIGAFDIDFVGDSATHSMTLEDAILSGDSGGDFRVGSTGMNSDTTVVLKNLSGDIGRDLEFAFDSRNGHNNSVTVENVTATVARDLVFNLPTDGTGSRSVAFNDVDLDVQRDVVIGQSTDFAVNPTAGELDTDLFIPTKIGRNLRVAGSLDLNDSFSRDSGLAVDNTGTVSTYYDAPGDGSPVFIDASFTGPATINGGTLNIEQTAGLDTKQYAKTTVIAADGATGAFDTVNAPSFGDDTAFAITYEANGVNAQRAYVGDATLNGGVGLKDFIITANNLGTQGTWVDGNFDNGLRDVNDNDVDATVASFGIGTEDAFDAFDNAFSLIVDVESGLLTLAGNGSLRAFSITSASGSLDITEQSDAFEYTLLSTEFAVARGDADDGVGVQGSYYELSERFLVDGVEDLMFGYGLSNSDQYLQGAVSYSRDDSPTPPSVIPTPTAAAAGLALLGLSMTRRRRRAR